MPDVCNALNSLVRMRCEIPGRRRWSAANRCFSFVKTRMISVVHFPERREIVAVAGLRVLSLACGALLCPPISVGLSGQFALCSGAALVFLLGKQFSVSPKTLRIHTSRKGQTHLCEIKMRSASHARTSPSTVCPPGSRHRCPMR